MACGPGHLGGWGGLALMQLQVEWKGDQSKVRPLSLSKLGRPHTRALRVHERLLTPALGEDGVLPWLRRTMTQYSFLVLGKSHMHLCWMLYWLAIITKLLRHFKFKSYFFFLVRSWPWQEERNNCLTQISCTHWISSVKIVCYFGRNIFCAS